MSKAKLAKKKTREFTVSLDGKPIPGLADIRQVTTKATRARGKKKGSVTVTFECWWPPPMPGRWFLTDSTRACYDEPGTGSDFFDARERLRVRLAEQGQELREVVDAAFVSDADVRKAAE